MQTRQDPGLLPSPAGPPCPSQSSVMCPTCSELCCAVCSHSLESESMAFSSSRSPEELWPLDQASPLPHPAPEGRTSAASTWGHWGLQTVWGPQKESQVERSSSSPFGLWDPFQTPSSLPLTDPEKTRNTLPQVSASQFSPKAPHAVAHSGSWTLLAPAHTAPQPPS